MENKNWLKKFIKGEPYNIWLHFVCDKVQEPKGVVHKINEPKKEITRFAEKEKGGK